MYSGTMVNFWVQAIAYSTPRKRFIRRPNFEVASDSSSGDFHRPGCLFSVRHGVKSETTYDDPRKRHSKGSELKRLGPTDATPQQQRTRRARTSFSRILRFLREKEDSGGRVGHSNTLFPSKETLPYRNLAFTWMIPYAPPKSALCCLPLVEGLALSNDRARNSLPLFLFTGPRFVVLR